MRWTLASPRRPLARLALFAALLVVVFGAAAAVGAAVDPGEPATCEPGHGAMAPEPLGLAVSAHGTTIAPVSFAARAGTTTTLGFRILDERGAVMRSGFEVEAERRMHLILVRRDLIGYQHLHPVMARDGTWKTPVSVPRAGAYRLFADFQRACEKHVLAADLLAPGTFDPEPLPVAAPAARTDGYDVRLSHAPLRTGREALLRFAVTRGGRPVAVQPYLGAGGHLVALRQGDLAYLHAHPEEEAAGTGTIAFAAEFLASGSYRLFLQFRAGGSVHAVPFTVTVAP